MTDYSSQMEKYFPDKLEKATKAWSDKLFSVDANSKRSSEEKANVFHSFAIKIIFLHERGRPDSEVDVSVLSL